MIYFTSDLHFYHDKIINMVGRPFSDAEEMNKALIRNWNRRVEATDEVYILGDVTMKGAARAEEVLWQLRGRKYLIRGNHDGFVDQADFDPSLFQWIKDYHVLNYGGAQFVLFHYPIEEWDQFFRGAYHLHGHRHGGPEVNQAARERGFLRYDVGVDANRFAPVSVEEIIAFFHRGGENDSPSPAR